MSQKKGRKQSAIQREQPSNRVRRTAAIRELNAAIAINASRVFRDDAAREANRVYQRAVKRAAKRGQEASNAVLLGWFPVAENGRWVNRSLYAIAGSPAHVAYLDANREANRLEVEFREKADSYFTR
jgi:hypothetical protein